MLVSELSGAKFTVDSAVAPRNASLPIVVTLPGIVIDVSAVALLKAPSLILTTPSGITATPAHEEFVVTTLLSTVNEPESTPLTLHGTVVPPPLAWEGLAASNEPAKANEIKYDAALNLRGNSKPLSLDKKQI